MIRFAVVLMLWSAVAHAQSAGAQAEALFREGRDLMAAGKTAEACNSFEASQKLEAQVTTLLNLAGCREKNGQIATAWGLFLEAERQTRTATDKATKQLHDVALSRSQSLGARVSKMSINVPDANKVDGLTIVRDKDTIDPLMWNRALPIDGGTYKVVVTAPGAAEWSTTVTVSPEGDTKTVDVPDLRNLPRDIVPDPHKVEPEQLPPPEDTPTPSTFTTKRKVAVGLGAVALVGIAGGVVLGTQASAKEDDAFKLCPDMMAACNDAARANDLLEAGRSRALGANIAFGVAGAAAIGAAVLWFTGAPKPNESVAIVPSLGSLTVVGRF